MSNSNKSNNEIPSVFQTIEDIVIKYLYSLEGHNLQFNLPGPSEPLVEHFPAHIIFWLYKDVYGETIGRTTTGKIVHSQNPDIDTDSQRRTLDRNIKQAVTRKLAEASLTGGPTDYYECVAQKSKGEGDIAPVYHLTPLDYCAVKEYSPSTRTLSIIDLLINKNISSSKKVSNQAIIDAYREYYDYIQKGSSQSDPCLWINALIDLSSLESQTAPGFLYATAKYAVTNTFKDIPDNICILHSYIPVYHLTLDARFIPDGRVESRFLYDRVNYIKSAFQCQARSPFSFLIMQLLSLQIRTLARGREKPIIFEKVPELHRHLTQVSYSDAAAYFRQKYNLFETYTFQELANQSSWTPALLKTYRKVAITLSRSHHSGQ